MKHKTWFRLVLKAIGVLLIGLAVPGVVTAIMTIADVVIRGNTGNLYSPYGVTTSSDILIMILTSATLQAFPHLVQSAMGAYLVFGGKWVVNKIIPSNRPYCPDCGYDLSHARGDRCPECGVTLPPTVTMAAHDAATGATDHSPPPAQS